MKLNFKKKLIKLKNLIKTLAFLSFFVAYILSFPSSKPLYKVHGLNLTDDAKIILYTKEKRENSVEAGDFYKLQTSLKQLKSTKEILSYSFITIISSSNLDDITEILKLQDIEKSEIAGGTIYNGYSPIISTRPLKDIGVNIQIFVKDGQTIIGSPTIFGSY